MLWVEQGVVGVLGSLMGGRVGKQHRKAYFLASVCLMWMIWMERNRRTFQVVEVSIIQLKRNFLAIL